MIKWNSNNIFARYYILKNQKMDLNYAAKHSMTFLENPHAHLLYDEFVKSSWKNDYTICQKLQSIHTLSVHPSRVTLVIK